MVILRFVIVSLSIHPKQKNLCHRKIIHHSLDNEVVINTFVVSWRGIFSADQLNQRQYLNYIYRPLWIVAFYDFLYFETCWLDIYSTSDHVKGWQFDKITKYSFSTFCGFTLHINRVPTTYMNNLCYWYFSSMSKNQKHMC